MFNDAYDLLFLGLGCGFSLITILTSWRTVDHDLTAFTAAQEYLKVKADEVAALEQTCSALASEYQKTYAALRGLALETIARGRSLMEFYRQVVQDHSKHRNLEIVFPSNQLPPDLLMFV